MTDLPEPPIPADADLTDFKFMPLEVARLRRSKAWLICKRRPELAFYMLNLWTASWHERPAGSLEDDDDVLADAAMCSPEKWAKVRTEAMRGWTKHSDGRLYHPVVAEKVMDSWHGKSVSRWEKECDRIRKENHRRKEKDLPSLDFPPKPNRKSAAPPAESPPPSAGIPPENALKGERREREREVKSSEANASGGGPPAGAGLGVDDPLELPGFLRRTPDTPVVAVEPKPMPPDPVKALFDEGVSLLASCGTPEKQARSLIGKWRAASGDEATHAAVKAAREGAITEPVAWITARLGAAKQPGETWDQRRIREAREAVR